jgi:hypothetical protein
MDIAYRHIDLLLLLHSHAALVFINSQPCHRQWHRHRLSPRLHPDAANGLSFEQEIAPNNTITNRHYISAGGMSIAVLTTNGEHTLVAVHSIIYALCD